MIILHSLSKLWKRVLNKSKGQSKLKNMISQELYLTPSKRCNGIQESMNCNIELKPDMNLNKKSYGWYPSLAWILTNVKHTY